MYNLRGEPPIKRKIMNTETKTVICWIASLVGVVMFVEQLTLFFFVSFGFFVYNSFKLIGYGK
jgi:hypothetical protein